MRTPNPQRSLGTAWLLRSVLVLVALAVVAAVLIFMRGKPEPNVKEPGLVVLPKPKSGYENRALRRWDDSAPGPRAKAPKLRGIVYDVSGKTLEGVKVAATTFQVAGNLSTAAAAGESDSQGRFELALPDGTYYLSGEKKGYTPALTVARASEEIGLVLHKSGEVSGHVKDEQGNPIQKFTIEVIAPGADDMAAPAPFVSRQFESEDGSFTITEMPQQGVFLRATSAGYAPAISQVVTVKEDKKETVDLSLGKGCVLTGTVVDSDGTPLADVFVDAELRKSAGVMGTTSVDAASQSDTDAAGRFRLENVAMGSVMVRAYDGTHAVAAVEMNIESCEGLTPMRIEMSGGSTLSGMVKDSDGKPLPGARITLSNRGTGFVETSSDAAGRYQFEKLPPGAMRLEAQAGSQKTLLIVGIPPATDREQDITFAAEGKGEIRGRITAGGNPLPGMQLTVVVNPGTGMLASRSPVTGADGSYRATGLKDGTYAVLLATTGQLAQVKIENGGTATQDFDVSVTPERGKMPVRPPPGTTLKDRAGPNGEDPKVQYAPEGQDKPAPRNDPAPQDEPAPQDDSPAP